MAGQHQALNDNGLILAIDLGKYKSVVGAYECIPAQARFFRLPQPLWPASIDEVRVRIHR